MSMGTWAGPIQPLQSVLPGVEERPGGQPKIGLQHVVTVPLVASTAASTNYVVGAFVAPSDGWYVEDVWYGAQVAPDYASATLAVENYDASANSAKNLLSATNVNLEAVTAKEGTQATLSATQANRQMDEGDSLIATIAIGATEAVVGLGIFMTLVLRGPEVNPQ